MHLTASGKKPYLFSSSRAFLLESSVVAEASDFCFDNCCLGFTSATSFDFFFASSCCLLLSELFFLTLFSSALFLRALQSRRWYIMRVSNMFD